MTPPFNSNDQWSPCPIGYLQRYALMEKRQLTLRLAGRVASIVALLAVTTSAAVYSYRTMSPERQSTWTSRHCGEISELLDEFKAGTLSAEETLKVQQHLDHCFPCRRLVNPHAAMGPMPFSPDACPKHAFLPGSPAKPL
ncbi:MAG: zf-HC2 domain-containing protein [Planctomycetota bacterium]|nr:zf-HC2 domain-containing protein [Planctomycetota bacterium]MDA1212346.1 zf-HC2 domain-containing protein [Planctomycetota bacterium]